MLEEIWWPKKFGDNWGKYCHGVKMLRCASSGWYVVVHATASSQMLLPLWASLQSPVRGVLEQYQDDLENHDFFLAFLHRATHRSSQSFYVTHFIAKISLRNQQAKMRYNYWEQMFPKKPREDQNWNHLWDKRVTRQLPSKITLLYFLPLFFFLSFLPFTLLFAI